MKQVASKVNSDESALLLRVEHLQEKTSAIVEEVGTLAKRKAELITRAQHYQGEFPQYIAQLLQEGSFSDTTSIAQARQNLKDTALMVLNTLAAHCVPDRDTGAAADAASGAKAVFPVRARGVTQAEGGGFPVVS